MKQYLVIVVFVLLAIGSFGCTKKAANTDASANANAAAESPFANITDPMEALAEGKRLLDENQTELAIQALKQAVKLNPDLAEAYFNLGIAYALVDMQKEQNGEPIEYANNSKDARSKTKSEAAFGKAVEAYKKWLAANPKDDVAHYNLGRTYAKLTKDEEAEDSFRQAVKLKPDDTEYQTELGAILIKLAKYREAIEPLKKAIELDGSNVRAQDLLEDAEAGRQRLDYQPKKDANANSVNGNTAANANSNAAAGANSSSSSNSKTNSATKQTPVPDGRPRTVDMKDKKGGVSSNRQ